MNIPETGPGSSAQSWHDELKRYEESVKKFVDRGNAVVKRYRDDRRDNVDSTRFNILWSNVRTLKPAIYSRPPKPDVSRRYKDNNDIARAASNILERCLSYEITQLSDYHSALSNAVEDRLLPGRGVCWLRYEPKTEEIDMELSNTDDGMEGDESSQENSLAGEEPMERISSETTPIDYVYWQDFAHLPGRTWEEVTWVARRVYLSLDEGVERFGDDFKNVPLTHSPETLKDDKASTKQLKKAEIWEIWCRTDKCVVWVARDYPYILDEKPDPLELENFFPCPKPLYATLTNDSLEPIADFILYQDQAIEIDEISQRIRTLTRSLKVVGLCPGDEPSIERLVKEGDDAQLIPVQNWPAYMEKGGLNNMIHWMPLGDIINALQQLYASRDACKQIIYEITGLSDIVRGASNAAETATAQQIKSQFASIRLNEMKDEVARFARDLLRMKAEIMCKKYQPETLVEMSGIMLTPDAQYAQQAIELLKNQSLRNFAIDIENDTLVQLDEQQDKQDRLEFLTAVSGFLKEAMVVGQQSPEMMPLLGEMLLFGIRGFKIGTTIEGEFETALQQLKQAQQAKAQQPQAPSPEQLKAQAEQQAQQARQQHEQEIEAARLMQEQQLEAAKAQAEERRIAAEHQREYDIAQRELMQSAQVEQAKIEAENKRIELERWKAQLEADTRIAIAIIGRQAPEVSSEAEEGQEINMIDALTANNAQMMQTHVEAIKEIVGQISKPKRVIRGQDGRVVGVENVV